MNDIGLPNILVTQASQPQPQPNAELSSRRTGSQILKREDSSPESKHEAFSDLVEKPSAPAASEMKSSDTMPADESQQSLNPADKSVPKQAAAGDDSLRPISIDRSRRNTDEVDSPNADAPSVLDVKGEHSKKLQAPENKKTKALKDFMAQMQQHFGVTPEQILQAFVNLSPKELMQSPQEVSAQIMKNLNLSEDQKPLAALIYQQMVTQTSDVKAQPLASAAAGKLAVGQQRDVVSGFFPHASEAETEAVGEAAKAELTTRLQALKGEASEANAGKTTTASDRANEKIGAEAALDAEMVQAKEQLSDLQKLASELKRIVGDDKSKDVQGLQQKLQAALGGSAAAGATTGAAAKAGAQAQNQSAMKDASPASERVNALAMMMGANAASAAKVPVKTDGAQAQIASNTDAAASLMPTLAALIGKFSGGDKNSSGEQSKGQKEMKAFEALQGSQANTKAETGDVFAALTQGAQGGQSTSHTQSGAVQNGQPVAASDLAATINEIIAKSQVLVKKGGGEMKIEMKSDSMGPMSMKVAVQNGQVNVSMVTQNDKAKKALEDNMHELKTALTAHKLEVGDLKVGLSEGAHKHQDQNSMDHGSREQAREAASQFLGNMHDEREQNRGGFFDQPGFHAYSQNPVSRPNLGPSKEVAATSMANMHRSFGRAGNSGRLSMVA